jgi:hypothetical protein
MRRPERSTLPRREFLKVLGGGAAALASSSAALSRIAAAAMPAPFFETRGVVILTEDITLRDWPERAKKAGLTTLSFHDGASPRKVAECVESDAGRLFLAKCKKLGLQVEYELHAMRELMPRELFAKDPAFFRMNEKGERTPDSNLCAHSKRALDIAAENAVALAKRLVPTTGRYFFWGDDAQAWCRCPECTPLSDSDQALLLANRLAEALKKADPRARVAHLAYANTMPPPKSVKPSPHVFLEFAPIERRYDVPMSSSEAPENARAIEALDANLAVFGAERAQALEYWLDVSRFSHWARPAAKLPFTKSAYEADVAFYGSRKIRHLTSFAAWIDADYVARFGDPPLAEYGDAMLKFRP